MVKNLDDDGDDMNIAFHQGGGWGQINLLDTRDLWHLHALAAIVLYLLEHS